MLTHLTKTYFPNSPFSLKISIITLDNHQEEPTSPEKKADSTESHPGRIHPQPTSLTSAAAAKRGSESGPAEQLSSPGGKVRRAPADFRETCRNRGLIATSRNNRPCIYISREKEAPAREKGKPKRKCRIRGADCFPRAFRGPRDLDGD